MITTLIAKALSRFYNETIESLCTRILYFFNTINTYFIFAGVLSFLIVHPYKISPLPLIAGLIFAIVTSKIADFFPYFTVAASPIILFAAFFSGVEIGMVLRLLLANIVIFCVIQFLFMGIPDSIVARDWRIGGKKLYNSIFTVAPTTVSFSMSVFFSFYLAFCQLIAVSIGPGETVSAVVLAGFLLLIAVATRLALPDNRFSKFHKPDIGEARFERLLILNIDGCRKDIFDALDLPAIAYLKKNGTTHARGLKTVYRALTNPAFASIFTGTIPRTHGVRDNNFGQSILTEGLPDIVKTIAYGSMHVKHFCKPYWETKIVSLPTHSAYRCDEVALEWLKEDLLGRKDARLFVFDFSEADFLGHAYGSESEQYKDALRRTDERIGKLFEWMKENAILENTGVIICSDHGIAGIDHSYLLAKAEAHVPFILYGKGIRKGHVIEQPGAIMDICITTAYLLGVRYPKEARGQAFTEALEGSDFAREQEKMVERFNRLKHGLEADRYIQGHPEIYAGDATWWDNVITDYARRGGENLRILDIGCGSGFVAERFKRAGVPFTEFVCQDISPEMLAKAQEKLDADERFSFVADLGELDGKFDIITASSVFHHLVRPEELGRRIDELLAPGGLVLGSHEPNRLPFQKPLFRMLARAYKALGGGFKMDEESVREFNLALEKEHPDAAEVCGEEIMQMVEFHSPVEQYDDHVDQRSGFVPEEFASSIFPGYEVRRLDSYTTFFHRPALDKRKTTQRILQAAYGLLFREGNLFRFVLEKK